MSFVLCEVCGKWMSSKGICKSKKCKSFGRRASTEAARLQLLGNQQVIRNVDLSSEGSTYEDMEESDDSDDDLVDMEISSAELNSIMSEGSVEEILLVVPECQNCHRQLVAGNIMAPYVLVIGMYVRAEINFRKKFSTMHAGDFDDVEELALCLECSRFLVPHAIDAATTQASLVVWPAFVWKLLVNLNVQQEFGNGLWALVPALWRPWWLDSLQLQGFQCYQDITLDFPQSLFTDVSADRAEFLAALELNTAGALIGACDKHIIPNICCPWGCTEYIHKVGKIPLDIVFARFVEIDNLDYYSPVKDRTKAESARDDFLFHSDACWLFNEEWRIIPAIAFFQDIGPCVLTCQSHDGGTNEQYFHVPRAPHHDIPAMHTDQLSHVVMRPRTIKTMKAKAYSNSYQMQEMQACYSGLDTCDLLEHGRFNFKSVLTEEKESLSMKGRADTKGLLSILVLKDVIPSFLATQMEENIGHYFPEELDEYLEANCKGSTYMPLDDALKLQKILGGDKRIKVMVTNAVNDTANEKEFCPNWPPNLVWLHHYDGFGCKFGQLPPFKTKEVDHIDSRLIWILTALVTHIPQLWEATIASLNSTEQWNGWLLAYCAKECFPHKKARNCKKNNPFKKILSIPELCTKVFGENCHEFNIEVLEELLHHIVPSVSVATCDEVVGGYMPDAAMHGVHTYCSTWK